MRTIAHNNMAKHASETYTSKMEQGQVEFSDKLLMQLVQQSEHEFTGLRHTPALNNSPLSNFTDPPDGVKTEKIVKPQKAGYYTNKAKLLGLLISNPYNFQKPY